MDPRARLRSIPFPELAELLGIDLKRFTRRKNDWQGYCPIHQSKNNNGCFGYNDTGKWNCLSCGVHGSGAIDLTMKVKDWNFTAAVALLENLQGSTPNRTEQPSQEVCNQETGELKPYKGSYEKFKIECEWLTKRIPDKGVLERYGVFCYDNKARKSAYSGRVMLPVRDLEGVLYGYLGRSVDHTSKPDSSHTAKYLFPKNLPKSKFLFGAYELREQSPVKVLYVVESPFCVLKFAMWNLPAVSPFGWAVSEEQVELLKQLTRGIVYLPDRNKYTECASCISQISSCLWVRRPVLPEGVDDPEALPNRDAVLALHS